MASSFAFSDYSSHPCNDFFVCNQAAITSLGGIEAIIAAMSSRKDKSRVQEHACGTLLKLAAKNEGIDVDICFSAPLILSFFLMFLLSSRLAYLHSFFIVLMNGLIALFEFHIFDCFITREYHIVH